MLDAIVIENDNKVVNRLAKQCTDGSFDVFLQGKLNSVKERIQCISREQDA